MDISWDFLGYSFFVGKGVLVPRSETEVLTEYALNRLKGYKNPVVYDLCSGSGCIGLSIKKLCPEAHVYLIEKSTEALFWLKKNVSRLGLEGEVNVIKGDILTDCFTELPPPDVIISNPPYIESGLLPSLQREVQMEPSLALDGGTDGLDFYRCLCENWFKKINRGGFMALECGEEQSGRIASLFPALTDVEVFCDYCGVDRFLAASCRAGSSPIAAAHEPPHTQATANRK